MLGRAAPEFFSLPLESKLRSTSKVPYQGYIGQVAPPCQREHAHRRRGLADRRPEFHPPRVAARESHFLDLVEMVQKMILQSLGVDQKHYDALVNLIDHDFGLSHYGVPVNQETKIALFPHLDLNLLSTAWSFRLPTGVGSTPSHPLLPFMLRPA
ncbi:hypothetical protein KSP40_PGU020408 [Platanthera guangdongensis]|uniref:Uncharacterized protein n=1 Tax=Platanthera guangdongensis TaxID=2320717 RepID=A0ABR2LZD1_9ASPA